MRRVFVLAFLPLVLFALEPVNLIKVGGFEKDSEVWQVYAGGDGVQDSAVANRHDPEKAYTGLCSASSDTRKLPGDYWVFYDDSAMLMQGFCRNKLVSDIDTLTISYFIIPVEDNFFRSAAIFIAVYLNAGNSIAGYYHKGPTLGDPTPIPPRRYIGVDDLPSDTNWCTFSWNLKADLLNAGISSSAPLDSFLIMGWGGYWPPWKGQKIYWDDIRLMGYADYDVGVKEILSPDSIGASGDSLYSSSPDPMYQPVARIKNFGREPADSFLAIAEIKNEYGLTYADTVPWSLDGDTEDTITFRHSVFEFPMSPAYTLTIRTVMEPDECDEDDEVSQTLYYSAVAEKPVANDFNLEVLGFFSDGVLQVTYLLPYGESGTLTLYDATGRRVERVTIKGPGSVEFESALPSGVYIVRLESGRGSISRKAVVLR